MARNRSTNEIEHLKGLIRQLQKENKQLKKQLGRANKSARQALEVDNLDLGDDATVSSYGPKCEGCGSHRISSIKLGPRTGVSCRDCGFFKLTKN